MLCDLHTHTRNSFDGDPSATALAMAQAAVDAGVGVLALTDHCEINGQVEGIYQYFDQAAAFAEMSQARDAYADRLTLLRGIELGQPMQYPQEAYDALMAHDYDFVILSTHNLPGVPDFYLMRMDLMSARQQHQLFDRMLDEMLRSIDFPGISTLAHLTYPCRYMGKAGADFDISEHTSKLTHLFERMGKLDVALEVNVSTLWKGLGFAMPDRDILSLYKSVGCSLVTVGSDAHAPENVGRSIADGFTLLGECGFDRITVKCRDKQIIIPIQ
ncbi:MAG: PHP domain-containing protein [Clostridia bacterium]|nr:PHP domain-containing protein [Clostridia bacterium]